MSTDDGAYEASVCCLVQNAIHPPHRGMREMNFILISCDLIKMGSE